MHRKILAVIVICSCIAYEFAQNIFELLIRNTLGCFITLAKFSRPGSLCEPGIFGRAFSTLSLSH